METAPSDKASNATIDKTRGNFAPVGREREREITDKGMQNIKLFTGQMDKLPHQMRNIMHLL